MRRAGDDRGAVAPIPTTLSRRHALASLVRAGVAMSAAAAAIPAAAASMPAADAGDVALLRLGAELNAAMAKESAAWERAADLGINSTPATLAAEAAAQALEDVTHRLVVQIAALPAATLAGLAVKARALAWCHGEPVTAEYLAEWAPIDTPTTDMRVIASICQDLVRIAGADASA